MQYYCEVTGDIFCPVKPLQQDYSPLRLLNDGLYKAAACTGRMITSPFELGRAAADDIPIFNEAYADECAGKEPSIETSAIYCFGNEEHLERFKKNATQIAGWAMAQTKLPARARIRTFESQGTFIGADLSFELA